MSAGRALSLPGHLALQHWPKFYLQSYMRVSGAWEPAALGGGSLKTDASVSCEGVWVPSHPLSPMSMGGWKDHHKSIGSP